MTEVVPGACTRAERQVAVDHLRGIAVILMIGWHTADGWLAPIHRSGPSWELMRIVGGMAAPLFLLLAGVGAGLFLGGGPAEAARRLAARGATIVAYGYLLRVQMWAIDHGGLWSPGGATAALGALLGVLGLRWALAPRGRPGRPARLGWAWLAALGLAASLWLIARLDPERQPFVLYVDVLQAIGATLLAISALAGRKPIPIWGYATLAAAVPLLTPSVTDLAATLPLPSALSDYFVGNARGTARFPLFPWLAYAMTGIAVGLALRRRGPDAFPPRTVLVVGAVLSALGNEHWGPARSLLEHVPQLGPAIRVLFRLGLAALLAAPLMAWEGRSRGLLLLGQNSLLAYWLHLAPAYGLLSAPVHRSLTGTQHLIGWLVLSVLTALACWLWKRFGPNRRGNNEPSGTHRTERSRRP